MNFHSVIATGRGFETPGGVREPAVAGSFYPARPAELNAMLDRLLADAPVAPRLPGALRAMICPHAGYAYSGRGAAANFKLLGPGGFSRVVLIGPSHHAGFSGASIPAFSAFRTPLGDVPLDAGAVADLQRCAVVSGSPDPHLTEHSLEVELPFLQRQLGAFALVPVLLGDLAAADYQALATALLPLWDPQTLRVVSSDFCHYGAPYQFEPFGKTDRDTIAQLDGAGLDQILAGNAHGFDEYAALSKNTICGRAPITLLLMMAQQRTIPPRPMLTSYYLSGDATGRYDVSVSYASIVFCEAAEPWRFEPALAGPLDAGEQRRLLQLARRIIEQVTQGALEESLDTRGLTPNLMRPGAAFVTLTEAGDLRGCIGSLVATEPLALSVARNAINAANHDPRFPAVRAGELARLHIEISVLTPPRRLRGIEEFEPGRHGLILEKDAHRGLFLPAVMVENKWSREQTLAQLCLKAGLAPDAWRSGYALYGFETQVFGEQERTAG